MRKILLDIFLLMLLPIVMWHLGTHEKYPELGFPLYLIWLAVIAPHLYDPNPEYARQKELEKYRKTALKYDDYDLADKIGKELQYIHDWSNPVTVGTLKSVLGKYDSYRSIGSYEIEKRLNELKAGTAKSS